MSCKQFGCCLKVVLFLGLAMQGTVGVAASIVGSKHDLSTAGGGGGSDEVCVFCHTPHDANIDLDNDENGFNDADHATKAAAPLWNRRITDMSAFNMYKSDTLNSDCDATPSPISLVCLSCHDSAKNPNMGGLGMVGAVSNEDTHFIMNEPNRGNIFKGLDYCRRACHSAGAYEISKFQPFWQIGPDLTDDHPISMSYPTPTEDPDFFIPDDLQKGWSDVKLFKGRIECPSCHNPHDPANVPFLRKSMADSGLCTVCHNK